VIFMDDKVNILFRVDEGLVEVVKDFERDSGYVGKVLEEVGVDLSRVSNVDFSGDLLLSEEAGFSRCESIAQEVMNHYTMERRKIVSNFYELKSKDGADEGKLVVLRDVCGAIEDRAYLLRVVYNTVKPSIFE